MKTKYFLLTSLLLMSNNSFSVEEDAIIFTAPPRESAEKGLATYKPIADFLSKKLNRKIIYKQPHSWAHYRRDITSNKIDIAFDGPHFVSWRVNNHSHIPVAKLPQQHVWTIVKKKGNNNINNLKDIQGKKFCGQNLPNFGTLTALSHYSVTREPLLIPVKGWKNVYKGVVEGKCVAGVLPITNLSKFDPEGNNIDVVHTHHAYPNQGFTVNSKFSPDFIRGVRNALLSPEGQVALSNLKDRYSKGKEVVETNEKEYRNVSTVLDQTYGFGYNFN